MEILDTSSATFAKVKEELRSQSERRGKLRKHDTYNLDRYQWEELIDRWIFKERDRAILKDRLINGMTFERLAEKHDMSVRQTKNIVYKAMEKLVSRL